MSAYQLSLELIRKSATPNGFLASIQEQDNYKRVWTRDGVITGMAALLTDDPALVEAFHATLKTIFNNQHPSGFIPSNVDLIGKVSYGGTVGRVDNGCWAIIGLSQYCFFRDDYRLFFFYKSKVDKILELLDAWEFNGKHLVYMPQSADWADEYISHGYLLFIQLLRVWALRVAGRIARNDQWLAKANSIVDVIIKNYWKKFNPEPDGLYAPNLSHQIQEASDQYWLMGFNPSRIYKQFDLQANALALLLGIGNTHQKESVLNVLAQKINATAHILPSYDPPIQKTDSDFQELKNNFAFTFRNHPHEFHNGGLWPVWNGFASAALRAQGATGLSDDLLNRNIIAVGVNDNEFNECFHGTTFAPVGVKNCVWSASGVVIAESFRNNKTLFFE